MSVKTLIWSSVLVASIAATASFLYYNQDPSPLPEITEARNQISKALHSKSDKYSTKTLKEAQAKYDSAMFHWKLENKRLFFLRDFTKSRAFADEAKSLALTGIKKSQSTATQLKSASSDQISNLKAQFSAFNDNFKNIQLTKELKNNLVQANLLFDQGKSAYERKDYTASKTKLDSAAVLIEKVNTYCEDILNDYFENFENWKRWGEQTIKESADKKSICILVDKYARKCYVYKKGKLSETYDAELGANWIGDKKLQGDKRTPEGFYKVTKKIEHPNTKYYKALLLNYPNDEDKARFEMEKRAGKIKASAKIGGLIEIHGNGGKGLDWTDGCVALTDSQMDHVYQICKTGTTVTIVGSLVPLHKIIN